MSYTLHLGDCLDVMRTLEPNSVDTVVTDPPYIIGGISVGNAGSKTGTWADMENAAYWYAEWLRLCARALGEGHLFVFGSWRTLPTLMRAFGLAEVPMTSCLVWDKDWIGPGGSAGFRPRYEIIAYGALGRAAIEDRGLPDIVVERWMAGNNRTSEHPAEKPLALMQRIVRWALPRGGVVLDPFMGSGTTGVAAITSGCSFVGIEREQQWHETATRRLAGAPVSPVRSRQEGLFPASRGNP